MVVVGALIFCSVAQGWQGDLYPQNNSRPARMNQPIPTAEIAPLPGIAGPQQQFAEPIGEATRQSVAHFGDQAPQFSPPAGPGAAAQSPSFAAAVQPAAQARVSVKSYYVEPARLIKLTDHLHAIYKQASGVVIAAERRDSKILVMADENRHAEIAGFMSGQGLQPAEPFTTNPFTIGATPPRSYRLRKSSWRDLESLIARIWRENILIRVSADGQSAVVLWPLADARVGNVRIDRATNTVSFDGPAADLGGWYHTIQAFDECAVKSSQQVRAFEASAEGAQAVNSAVAMCQLLSLHEKNRLSQAHNTLNTGLQKKWGGKLVSHIFQTAQENEGQPQVQQPNPLNNQQDAENGQENQPNLGQAGDSLSGNVTVEILPDGTVIVIGMPEDTKQVTDMIQKLLAAAKLTAPNVEIVPLENVAGATVQPVVQQIYDASYAPRLGPATATNLGKPNAIMVVGSEESVAALKELILKLDVPSDPSENFRVFRIKHMSAIDASNRLANLFGVQIQTQQQQQIQQTQTTGANAAPQLRIVPDYRSNSIVVQGSPAQLMEAEKFIEAFDVEENGAFNDVRIIRLRNSIATELAPVLQDALNGQLNNAGRTLVSGTQGGQAQTQTGQQQQANPLGSQVRSAMIGLRLIDPEGHTITSGITFDVRITPDANSNSLIVNGPAKTMDLIEMLVKQLDKLPSAESVVKVFTIVNGDATTLLETVQTLFTSTGQQGGGFGGQQGGLGQLPLATGNGEVSLVSLRFSVDARTNSILVAGSESDINVIEALLTRLDADQMNNRIHRVFRLQHVVATDVATAISNWLTARESADQGDPTRATNFQIGQRVASVTAEGLSNSLIVSATPDYFALIEQIIRDIDRRRRVMVQAVISEVSLSGTDEFGFEWGIQDSILFDRGLAGTSIIGYPFNQAGLGNSLEGLGLATREDLAGQALSNLNIGRSSSNAGYGGLVLSAGNESINLLMRALRDRGQSRILGRPQIMTLENLRGYTQVGQQIPTPTPSTNATTTTTSYSYLSTGVQLGVVPRVGADGTVYMEVDVINSSLDSGAGIVIQTISTAQGVQTVEAPIINQTLAQTTVSCRSGQTIVIGGLITTVDTQNRRGIPILSEIPAIGALFRFDSLTQTRTELVIILRPIVIEDDDQLAIVNQLEMDRMHWCYSDVVKLHGELDQLYPDFSAFEDGATDVIYPDRDPSGRPIMIQSAPIYEEPSAGEALNPNQKSLLPSSQDLPTLRREIDN